MTSPAVELDDIQGLVRSGFKDLVAARFMLLRIVSPEAARAWLGAAPVTSASFERRHAEVLQVAFTAEGLSKLGLGSDALASFPAEFLSGMAGDKARSRRLGDVGGNAPERWQWGTAGNAPDAMVMLYARAGRLDAWHDTVATAGFRNGFALLATLETTDMDGREPFGFADGISQPEIDWQGRRHPPSDADLEYGNLIALGEFVLGYDNEYGFRTDSPSVPASNGVGRDLGRNGTYLVLRQLDQDVRGFWDFLAAKAPQGGAIELAEAMVGRRMSGESLVEPAPAAIRGVGRDKVDLRLNGFTFAGDAQGLRCPLGAHIRRANPRNGDMPGGRQGPFSQLLRLLGLRHGDAASDVIASSRFHRMLRRGRAYASPSATGLYFIGLNANITRQFEFIQNAWLHSAKFGGLAGDGDPLIGNREPLPDGTPTDVFTCQGDGACQRITGLPSFVTVQGGAYFFLPGLRALRSLASL